MRILICGGWLDGWRWRAMRFIENDEAQSCEYADNPAKSPEQTWICAVQQQTRKIGTHRKGNTPRETGNCHVTSAHVFGCEARHQRLLKRCDNHFADSDDDHRDHEKRKRRDEAVHGKSDCIK